MGQCSFVNTKRNPFYFNCKLDNTKTDFKNS